MSTTIAIVLNVSGTAWAEAPDGSRRLLEEGSALMAGERLVTEDDARVQLDFGYDNLTVIEGGTTILATAEMAGDFIPVSADTSLEDDSVAQALASIEAALGGSIEDAEAPAAGLDGAGGGGGSSAVRLARIVEDIDPAEFDLETSSVANRQFAGEFNGTGEDGDLNTAPDNTTVQPGDISIDSISGGSIASPTLIVSGSSSNLLPASVVQITITDQDGNTVSQQIITGPNGEFTGVFSQVIGLVDGPLTIEATGTGLDGGTVSDNGQGNLDLIAGALDVSIDNVDDGAQTIGLSGTTTDVAPNESVSITITDVENNVVTTTATVAGDGSYTVTGTDISDLVDGNLAVEATATDRNNNSVSDTANGTLDAITGSLIINTTSVDDTAGTMDITGITVDVALGSNVDVTVIDTDGTEVTINVATDADGSYTVTGADISGLLDGPLEVEASAIDRNGTPVSDTATDALDTNTPPEAGDDSYGTSAIQGLFGEYFAHQDGNDPAKNLSNLAQVDKIIAENNANATFVGTSINYGSIRGDLGSDTKLQQFLKGDAGSLSDDPINSSDAIIRLTGSLDLSPGTYQFRVSADDGYRIRVDGNEVIAKDSNGSASPKNGIDFTLAGNEPHSVEIVYWDQRDSAMLKVQIREAGTNNWQIFGSDHVSGNGIDSALVTDENQVLTIAPSTLLDNDSDTDGDSLSIQSVQDAVNGDVSLDASGNILFSPDAYYVGDATFNYTISDGRGGEDTATVTLNVRAAAGSISGTDQADTLNGSGTDDVIRGFAGDDTLNGGAGNDVLIGGSGGDILTGGIGADVFRWALEDESDGGTTNDVVTDFTTGQGDQLELSDLLQGVNADGSTTAIDIGGYLMAEQVGNDTVLYLNKDGGLNNDSDNAQQSITLNGVNMNGGSSETFIDTMLANDHIKIE